MLASHLYTRPGGASRSPDLVGPPGHLIRGLHSGASNYVKGNVQPAGHYCEINFLNHPEGGYFTMTGSLYIISLTTWLLTEINSLTTDFIDLKIMYSFR